MFEKLYESSVSAGTAAENNLPAKEAKRREKENLIKGC